MKPATIKRWLALFAIFAVLCVLAYPFAKRTLPDEIIRSLVKRVPPAQLWADDLADDVRTKKRLAPLQDWSVQTLARYRAGQLATKGRSSFVGPGAARLDPKEIPGWLNGAWWGDPPQVSVLYGDTNKPGCISVAWYLCGLLVGPTNFTTDYQPFYITQVKPGIYAYSIEK
jgi:hypothetical protein